MIIIYNISGLLIGVLGLFFGLLVAGGLATVGSPLSLCPGLLGIAGIWWVYGRGKPDLKTGEMRPAPSIFFIPLRYWGVVVALLSVPMGLLSFRVRRAQIRQEAVPLPMTLASNNSTSWRKASAVTRPTMTSFPLS